MLHSYWPLKKEIHGTNRFIVTACHLLSVYSFHLLLFFFSFKYSLSCLLAFLYVIWPTTGRDGHECFHFGVEKKKTCSLSCHRIKRKMKLDKMHENIKWQRLDWTVEWLSKASQLGSQIPARKCWYFDSTSLLVYMKFKWWRNAKKQTLLGRSHISLL